MSDIEIKNWNEIKEDFNNKETSILLGNGFSIGYNESFNYKSLYERLEEEEKDMKDMFDKLDTKNFEDVLKCLHEIYTNENLIKLGICEEKKLKN